jgi:hypothetical protein
MEASGFAHVAMIALVGALSGSGFRRPAPPPQAPAPAIHLEDVERFYRLYDATGGHPTAAQLQHDYLDRGSPGLLAFAKLRRITGTAIAEMLAEHPEIYAGAKRCTALMPRIRARLDSALDRFVRLYPEGRFPPVTIAIGRGKPVGVGNATGVMIGLEALCAVEWLDPDIENRFVHVIAHEYVHTQQVPALVDDEHPTVLEASLIEGAAEFVGELISGGVAYAGLARATAGHEEEIETRFLADKDETDLSRWLYNASIDKPGDLGYWVGYRIVKSAFQGAADRRSAVKAIIELADPQKFLETSGWRPGLR